MLQNVQPNDTKLHIQDQRFYSEEESSIFRKQNVNSNKKNQQAYFSN